MNTNTSIAYASARIDGVLDCNTLKVGILKTSAQATPAASFLVTAGLQRHPVWALDRLAVVVYCYCLAVKEHHPSEDGGVIEVNLAASLISGAEAVCMVAGTINWHTSKEIRNQAEAMIEAMSNDGSAQTPERWPFKGILQLPVRRP